MKTDVLIVGGGLAGLTAANEILQNSNLTVTLLQWGSGASAYIHGFCMPVDPADSPELFLQDTLNAGYRQSDPVLAETLCRNALELMPYFQELGLDLDRKGEAYSLLHALGSTVPRIGGIRNNTGPVMLNCLRKRLRASNRYRELKDHRGLSLEKRGDRVTGVRCYDRERDCFYTITAGVVILACGGFGRLFPESTNPPDLGGDGGAMAFDAGAKLTDMEFIQFEPTAAVWPPETGGKAIVTTMFYDGAVLRSADGRRFMTEYSRDGERMPKDVLSQCIYRQIRAGGGTQHGGVWFDATQVPEEKWQGVYKPYLNRYLACGIDLRKEPVEIAPSAHTTCGGIRIDGHCRTGVPGLLACAEAAGGLHGANRLGGNAGLETMVFGRIAGKTAVSDFVEVEELPEGIVPNRGENTRPQRSRLEALLRNSLNVVRNGKEMARSLWELDAILAELDNWEDSFERYRLRNDLLTARMALASALERKGSVGCHIRDDAVKEMDSYRVIIQNAGGHMTVLRESI